MHNPQDDASRVYAVVCSKYGGCRRKTIGSVFWTTLQIPSLSHPHLKGWVLGQPLLREIIQSRGNSAESNSA